MAMTIEKSGIKLSAIYRPLNNFFMNKIMESLRTKYICKIKLKKEDQTLEIYYDHLIMDLQLL